MMASYLRRAIPVLFCLLLAAVCALAASRLANLSSAGVFSDYAKIFAATASVSFGLWTFWFFARLALRLADRPLTLYVNELRLRWPLLLLPLVAAPFFMTCFTISKSGIAIIVGFPWDGPLTDLDRSIFGDDPWKYTHTALGPKVSALFSLVYTYAWGMAFVGVQTTIILVAATRKVFRFYTAMFLTWLVGGIFGAYLLASAGPVFLDEFEDLRASLAALLSADDAILVTQAYLASADSRTVLRGDGISAMPSMHVAAAAIYVFAARGTHWFWPALAFLLLIWVGSVHFGYHYATDGLVGIGAAWVGWRIARAVSVP